MRPFVEGIDHIQSPFKDEVFLIFRLSDSTEKQITLDEESYAALYAGMSFHMKDKPKWKELSKTFLPPKYEKS